LNLKSVFLVTDKKDGTPRVILGAKSLAKDYCKRYGDCEWEEWEYVEVLD